ncbi:MAG: 30S ribosomal protein S6 [Deltaproteobacteria bacterium]|jgi:small subunit ribosomal protein S6|nr:30S ribosomal protein S6 [Deltaproteobacteria bacterium]MDP7157091.1 30S ribosomal protein S6 [SAR324 cluster bacterium]MDP7318692.1 30S ribosomal protein S6 [SAR324 cluster bacterium]MDP7463648.1 30S ribosomal protein S6 [SAR324 cluster bacterium]MDP7629694.1 30S ribosomal protein S6 [SAR324 cluster bacterium]|tara:strand:+ start:430 stop:969 length:540 start_codon:yes stop_codon:yes gene_type:complete
MSSYEIIFITSARFSEEEQSTFLKKAESTLKKEKATVEQQFVWGRRRLAYPIDDQDYGVYHIWYVEGPGSALTELERQFNLTDDVLRFFSLRVSNIESEASQFKALLAENAARAAERAATEAERAAKFAGKTRFNTQKARERTSEKAEAKSDDTLEKTEPPPEKAEAHTEAETPETPTE